MDENKAVYAVFKTHVDIGYTGLAEEVMDQYRTSMLPDAVKTCRETKPLGERRRFVWTMPAWPLLQSLDSAKGDMETIDDAKELISEGQIAWHLLPFTTHTEFCGLEEFIRGMYFSRQLSMQFGEWPLSAKMTDVPGHTRILPSLLYKAGVRFLHLGCNPGCMPPDVPRLFFWEGPDGDRILTFYSKGGYGSTLIPPEDWPYPVWLALIQTNDNLGPQGPEIINEIIRELEEIQPDTEIIIGTLDDFYKALLKCNLQDVPVLKCDLSDTWIHGVGTYPREVSKLRELRHKLADTEKIMALGHVLGIFAKEKAQQYARIFSEAYENCILFGEHTWGLDVKTTLGGSRHYSKKDFIKDKEQPLYKRIELSWDEQRDRVNRAEDNIKGALPKIMEALADAVYTESPRIAVFNSLGWKRSSWVDLQDYRHRFDGMMLIDHDSGEEVEAELLNGRFMAYVKDMPPFGYKTIEIKAGGYSGKTCNSVVCDQENGILESRNYRIEIDKTTGTISRLLDKTNSKEWVDVNKHEGFGQYRYDIFGIEDITEYIRSYAYRFYDWLLDDLGRKAYPPQEHLAFVPSEFTVEAEQGTGYGTLVLKSVISDRSVSEFGNTSKLIFRITIYDKEPYIDLVFMLEDKEETPLIEAGHFTFPLNLKDPQIRVNKLGNVIDPAVDIVKDANHLLYCCENWVDVSDGENGMAFIPFDTPLFSIGGQAIYKYSRQYEKKDPVIFFNAFNNSWGTNFPQWMGGNYSFRYRLLPHNGDWGKGDIARIAMESIIKPIAGYSEARGEGLPPSSNFLQGIEGMQVQALKPAEEGMGLIIRLREIRGEARDLQISFEKSLKRIARCNLLEAIESEMAANTDRFSFETRPFEIHTFLLEF